MKPKRLGISSPLSIDRRHPPRGVALARGPDHPVRFTGSTDGHLMTLTVALTDTAVTLGPVQLELRKEPRMGPCPICRKPAR